MLIGDYFPIQNVKWVEYWGSESWVDFSYQFGP